MKLFRRLTVLGAAVALVAVACGGGESVDPAPEGLSPKVAGGCEVDAPDCDDVPDGRNSEPLFVDGEPELEPDLGVDPGGGVGLVIDGGLSVAEALETDATGIIAVQGFVVQDHSGVRLCDLLAESRPPLCGGASVEVSDLGSVDPDELSSAQGVTWSDQPVTILGELIDGILVPTPFSI